MSKLLLGLRGRVLKKSGKRKSGRCIKMLFLLVVLAIFTVFGYKGVMSRLRYAIEQLAISRIHYIGSKLINEAIDESISSGAAEYENFVHLEKDTQGKITALRTDMAAINSFKSLITGIVIERINSISPSQLSIPFGNLILGELFSGKGPVIKVLILPIGSATAKLDSIMLTAGINQTRHRIILTVSADITILLPGFTSSAEVSSQASIAETVIVGEVPQTYTYLEDTGQSGMDIWGNFVD